MLQLVSCFSPHWGVEKKQEKTGLEDLFKLPDLLMPEDTKAQQAKLQWEKELLKPLKQLKIKPRVYARGQFDKGKIKLELQYSKSNKDSRQKGG